MLTKLSTAELERELARRQQSLSAMQRKRESLSQQLEEIDRELAQVSGRRRRDGGWVRARAKNDRTLAEALTTLLTGRELSVTDAAAAVQKAGYKTVSPNFATIVNQTLINHSQFKRVARGRYTVR